MFLFFFMDQILFRERLCLVETEIIVSDVPNASPALRSCESHALCYGYNYTLQTTLSRVISVDSNLSDHIRDIWYR